jgi:protein SCO1/2
VKGLLIVLVAAAALAQSPLPAVPPGIGGGIPTRLPDALRDVGITQKLDAQLPLDLAFTDENGRRVQLREYFGKRPVILSFVYYDCPMLCTMVLNGLVRGLRPINLQPGRDFEIVTVSFDSRETPVLAASKKRSYLNSYRRDGAEQGWHFLTGGEASVKALAAAAGFRYRFDESSKQFAHASGVMVTTPGGKLSRYFYGVEFSARDLRLSVVDASAGKIGSLADQMLLFCFHYDPATAKYGVAIMNVTRALAAATVLALGGFMLIGFLHDRRVQV